MLVFGFYDHILSCQVTWHVRCNGGASGFYKCVLLSENFDVNTRLPQHAVLAFRDQLLVMFLLALAIALRALFVQ